MGVECQILIERAKNGVFRPGELVVGTVKYFIDKPTKFRSIHISFLGKGTCHWSEVGADKSSIEYDNREEYVKENRNLFIATDDQDVLLSGTFKYPFEFLLPDDIPSSIKINTSGKIEYKVIVIFVKTKGFRTINEFSKEIPVYGYVSPCAPEPLKFCLKKNLFFLTSDNDFDVKAEINKTFLNPGDTIRLRLTINNDTDFPITIKAELFEYFTYNISDCKRTRVFSKPVETTKTKSISIVEKSVSIITCIVPTLPSLYSIQHSKIIKGEFKVRVAAKLPFPHTDAEVQVPVVIGDRRDHLGAAVVGYDDGNSSSSKTPEKDDINLIDL